MDHPVIDYKLAIQTYYREAVAAHSSPDDVADRQECIKEARDRILEGITDGDIAAPDTGDLIARDLLSQDTADKQSADAMIDLLVYGGQDTLDLDDFLDVVVTLGAGRRKPWRFVSDLDLESMDEVRYANLEKQQSAYSSWRPKFLALRAAYRVHGTTESVYAAGPCGAEAVS